MVRALSDSKILDPENIYCISYINHLDDIVNSDYRYEDGDFYNYLSSNEIEIKDFGFNVKSGNVYGDALAYNTTINNIKSSQTNQTNQQKIKLNIYGSEDLSHITDFFKTNLLSLPHGMIPKMIEAVHFNNDKPENKNILLPNKKDNKMKVFSGDKWVYKDKNETLNDLMDGKYFIMDTHYETICDTTDKNFTLFKRFQELFDKRNKIIVDSRKKECELLLLNNR